MSVCTTCLTMQFGPLICVVPLWLSLRLRLESDLSLLADEKPLEELVLFDMVGLFLCRSLDDLSLNNFNLSNIECLVGAFCWCGGGVGAPGDAGWPQYGLDGILLPGVNKDELGRDL